MSPKTFRHAHACYSVIVPANHPENPMFIGSLPLTRLHTLEDARRNSEWERLIPDDQPIIMNIVAITETAEQAQFHASIEIAAHKPHMNMHGIMKPERSAGRSGKVRNLDTGEIYPTATSASIALGVTTAAMSRHLNGHLKHLRGYRFERIA